MTRTERQGQGRARRQPEERARPRRVLIADADPQAQRHLDLMAVDAGYHVVAAVGDRDAALRAARETQPDLVIADAVVAGGDVLQELRGQDAATAPLVVLTAANHHEALERGRDADIAAYLIKPLRAESFRPTVEVALARGAELRAARARVVALDEELRARGLIERAKGVLMDTQGLSEAEAHRCLQRQSMETRRRMRDVAAAIIAGEAGRVCA